MREGGPQRQRDQGHLDGQVVTDGLAQVVVEATAFRHRPHQGGKVVVGDHQVCGFPGDIGCASSHRDPNRCGTKSRRVINPVAGDRHDLASGAETPNDSKLGGGQAPTENRPSLRDRGEFDIVHPI